MRKYRVFGIVQAYTYIGTYKAEDYEAAKKMAEKNAENPVLCHECAEKLEIEDIYEYYTEEAP